MTDLTEKRLATERKYTGKIINVDLLDIEYPTHRRQDILGTGKRT